MIISASRRTDIPSYYSEWFYNRIKEGFAVSKNPMNPKQSSKVPLTPDTVDAIVFWTKNPAPMIGRLDELKDYNYYFQFTLTPYDNDIEKNLPVKYTLIDTFKRLSDTIGPERMVWRYDPVLINNRYGIDHHLAKFAEFSRLLSGYTANATVSFLDYYKKIDKRLKEIGVKEMDVTDKRLMLKEFAKAANESYIKVYTCAEEGDYSEFGILKSSCIDKGLIERISGKSLNISKDTGQRKGCGCVKSVDIGVYNTCMNGCTYCYANYSEKSVWNNFSKHDESYFLMSGRNNDTDSANE